jgi:hypothetical protein
MQALKETVTKPGRRAIGVGVGLSLLAFGAPLAGTASAAHIGCGTTITANTTLHSDIGPCAGNGIIIGADNITLNLNGHQIFGTPEQDDGDSAGIRLPQRTGVTITSGRGPERTGTVRDFAAGVLINGGSSNNVGNLIIRDNTSPGGDAFLGDGIVLFRSRANRIINNLVTHNGPFDGIGMLGAGSDDNRISHNTVELTSTGGDTDAMSGGGTGIILNAFLDDTDPPVRGLSIYRNRVTDNNVSRNDNAGISNVSHVEGRVERNVVQDNGQLGETCFDFLGSNICQPTATPSNGIGVTVGPESEDRTRMFISGNTVTGNTGDGIVLGRFGLTVRENRVIGNVATGNGGSPPSQTAGTQFEDTDGYDLHDYASDGGRPAVYDCDNNVWRDNIFGTAFPNCIYEQHGQTPPRPTPPPPNQERPPPGGGPGGPIIIGPVEPGPIGP